MVREAPPAAHRPPAGRLRATAAATRILGDRNWWVPTWLDRVLPHVAIERRTLPAPTRSSVEVGG